MSDPREVSPRCHQRLRRTDFAMARGDYVCVFYADHDGMHLGRMMREDTGEIVPGGEVIRWGTPGELAMEAALMMLAGPSDLWSVHPALPCPLEETFCGCELAARCDVTMPSGDTSDKEDRSVKNDGAHRAAGP